MLVRIHISLGSERSSIIITSPKAPKDDDGQVLVLSFLLELVEEVKAIGETAHSGSNFSGNIASTSANLLMWH